MVWPGEFWQSVHEETSPLKLRARPGADNFRVVPRASTSLPTMSQSNGLPSALLFAYSKLRPQLQM